MLKVGDWVTQYATGYWQVVALFPHNSDGERVGEWAIIKKGLTLQMKPVNACECVDSRWCRPVSEETRVAIEAIFAANPRAKERFAAATNMPQPGVMSFGMNLPADRVEDFVAVLASLPPQFTVGQLWQTAQDYRRYVVKPPAAYTLCLHYYPWETDNKAEMLCFSPVLKESET